MNNPVEFNPRIQAAGAVTIIFGVLTAMLPAAWVVILLITHGQDEMPPMAQMSLTLLVGIAFVMFGWGVLRHMRFCAALAGALATAPLTLQLMTAFGGKTEHGSMFFLVLSAFVLGANCLAWREIGRLHSAVEELSPASEPLHEEA